MANIFREQISYDHEIIDPAGKGAKKEQKIGTIRVKPNNILWKKKGQQDWYGVTLKEFSDWIEETGKKQSK